MGRFTGEVDCELDIYNDIQTVTIRPQITDHPSSNSRIHQRPINPLIRRPRIPQPRTIIQPNGIILRRPQILQIQTLLRPRRRLQRNPPIILRNPLLLLVIRAFTDIHVGHVFPAALGSGVHA